MERINALSYKDIQMHISNDICLPFKYFSTNVDTWFKIKQDLKDGRVGFWLRQDTTWITVTQNLPKHYNFQLLKHTSFKNLSILSSLFISYLIFPLSTNPYFFPFSSLLLYFFHKSRKVPLLFFYYLSPFLQLTQHNFSNLQPQTQAFSLCLHFQSTQGGRMPKDKSIKNEGFKLVTQLPKKKFKGSKGADQGKSARVENLRHNNGPRKA